MSGTVIPSPAPVPVRASDTMAEYGAIAVSMVVLTVFLAAIVIAWITKNASLDILLGIAGSNATIAVGFWLGSSRSSQKKDTALAEKANAP